MPSQLVTVEKLDADVDFSSAPTFHVMTIDGKSQRVCWQDCHVTAIKRPSGETEKLKEHGQVVLAVGIQLYIMPIDGRDGKVLEK